MAATKAAFPQAPLAGRGIVVTRPAAQARHLSELISSAGGTPIEYPLIEIRALADAGTARACFAHLGRYQLVVFVSANAVEHGCALLEDGVTLPRDLAAAAVGTGTARALHAHGVERVVLPAERFDSEGLLALPELRDVEGRRVLIVRGRGGRELLGDALKARGASVDYAECYERAPPSAGAGPLLDAWCRDALHAITITSSEGLRHLHALLPEAGRERLRATPLFVTHERMADAAHALGLHDVVMARPGDEGLFAALLAHFTCR